MRNQSLEHQLLVQKAKERFNGEEYITIKEGIIKNKDLDMARLNGARVDLIVIKGFKVVRLIEVIKSQTIDGVRRRLNCFKIDCEKEIVRKFKNKNPKAKKAIKQVIDDGIIFTEFIL